MATLCWLAVSATACGTLSPTPPDPSGSPSSSPTATARPSSAAPSGPRPATCAGAGKAAVGVFRQTAPREVDAFESWLGCRVDDAVDYSARATWEDISNPDYLFQAWAGQPRRLVLGVAMLPEDDASATMATGASGSYDAYFRTLAEKLVAAGQEDAVLRVGWEFNLSESRWFTRDPEAFKNYWRSIANAMSSVAGSKFQFDWNPNNGTNPVDASTYYPGDDVVDIIGIDAYDVSGADYPYATNCDDACRIATQTEAWNSRIYGGERGLKFWSAFARSHRKPMSLPEWGLWRRPDGTGGAENTPFIRRMHAFIVDPQNNLTYQAYFEFDGDDGEHRLMTTFTPSGAVFRQLFTTKP